MLHSQILVFFLELLHSLLQVLDILIDIIPIGGVMQVLSSREHRLLSQVIYLLLDLLKFFPLIFLLNDSFHKLNIILHAVKFL